MNNINKYPVGWRGHHPKPKTITKASHAREAREKIEKRLYGFKRLFFNGKLPIKPKGEKEVTT